MLQLQCLLELFQILVLHFNFLYKVHNSYNTGWKICDTVAERLEGMEKICSSPFSSFGAGKKLSTTHFKFKFYLSLQCPKLLLHYIDNDT